MIGQCSDSGLDASLLQRLGDYVECHADAASRAGFDPAQGGPLAAAILTSCLTLYVALIGYRMMLGQGYDPRGVTLAALRAGLVIAFSTSWASYEPMVQAVVLRGPAEIASTVLRATGLEVPTSTQKLGRLDRIADELRRGPPRSAPEAAAPPRIKDPSPAASIPATTASAPPLLLSTTSADLALRLAAGFLLGLGPLLIPFALFDTLLSLVEGWVRALLGVTLGAAAVLVVATFELDFLETELARTTVGEVGALSQGGVDLITAVFGMAGWAVLVAAVAIAWGFRFRRFPLPTLAPSLRQPLAAGLPTARNRAELTMSEPARARSVAEAVIAQGRRDRALGQVASHASPTAAPGPTSRPTAGSQDATDTLGTRRSAAPRRSITAPRRERRS